MESTEWIGIGTVAISVLAACIAVWQADIARKGADESKRSADAAVGQLALMQEQWESEKKNREEAIQPSLKLYIQSLIPGADYLLMLTNRGEKVVHIDEITFKGHSVPYMDFKGQSSIPMPLNSLPPSKTIAVFRGIHPDIQIIRGPFCRETDWAALVIQFSYASKPWRHYANVRVLRSGELELGPETTEPIP